jgi:hypothetical protein
MKVSSAAQRDVNQARVDKLAAHFDLEQLGNPTVNLRDGHYWIIDGQHRIEALRQLDFGGYDIECWTYEGLTEDEEAEKFLKLNDVLTVDVFYKFRVGVQAGRPDEVEIQRIITSLGLAVTRAKSEGAVRAVGTLRRVYTRSGSDVLERTLRTVRDAYGDAGLEAPIIDGIGHLIGRYDGVVDDDVVIERLSRAHGGPSGLLAKAKVLQRQTGSVLGQCVAAAAVETINRGRGGRKLPDWWKA